MRICRSGNVGIPFLGSGCQIAGLLARITAKADLMPVVVICTGIGGLVLHSPILFHFDSEAILRNISSNNCQNPCGKNMQIQPCALRMALVQLALTSSYKLLSELVDYPLGEIYQQQAAKIQNALQIRNHSLFAHGFKPIAKGDYQEFSKDVVGFIQADIAAIVLPGLKPDLVQFPRALSI